jgi:hypothetical protein
MKLTKTELKQLIKEELLNEKLNMAQDWYRRTLPNEIKNVSVALSKLGYKFSTTSQNATALSYIFKKVFDDGSESFLDVTTKWPRSKGE